jgi:hypothetical protein
MASIEVLKFAGTVTGTSWLGLAATEQQLEKNVEPVD